MFRYRTGCPWRDLPARFGPWQTVWKRHARFSRDGTWDAILLRLVTEADAAGQIDWAVSVDSTISRVHQHAASLPREVVVSLPSHTGGPSNYKNPLVEPVDHAVGRARGGLTTKLHTLVDGRGRPLVVHAGPEYGGDSPMLTLLLGELRVPRLGPGRAHQTRVAGGGQGVLLPWAPHWRRTSL